MEARKSKILVRYDEIFNKDVPPEDLSLDEVFLIRGNTDYLVSRLNEVDEAFMEERREVFSLLMGRSAECVANETSVAVYNACQTFVTVLKCVVPRFGFRKSVDLLFEDAEHSFTAILRRFYFFMVESVPDDLKTISMHFLQRLSLLPCDDADLPLFANLIISPSFDVITAVFAQTESLHTLGPIAMRVMALMLSRVQSLGEKDDFVCKKLASLHDDLALQGLSDLIVQQMEASNAYYAQYLASSNGSVISRLASIFSNSSDDGDTPFDPSLDLPCLFALFEAIRYNKPFVSTILTMRSSIDSSTEDKERSLVLRYFFAHCSLAFEETKNEPGLFSGRLCLLILLLLADDVFVQNALHDPHNVSVVPLFRPAMLHRPAQLDCRRPSCTLGTTVLDIITELLVSHLKIGFPLEFYDLALGIVHRLLAYQKNRCVRMSQWQPLFNAMLSLMRFLVSHEGKCTMSIYPLCFRIIVVINLFLTFGDTFLPSGEAYDLLYYELVRQESIFVLLQEAVERRLEKEKDSDWEFAAKVKNHLVNPMIIINTIKEKIAQAGGGLEQEQIIEMIRSSFETLSLKLYDGLTVVAPYEHDRQRPFFLVLGRTLMAESEKRKASQLPPFDYATLVENLSSIRD